jgi:hypothetical protein
MARILMNLILMQQGYKPAIIRLEKKEEYYRALNQSSEESPDLLVGFVADELLTSMEIAIRGAKGEIIEDELDLEKEVELLKRMQHQPIKRSKEVEKEVLDQIYLPLLSELDEKLELIGELFDESSWTYFEEHEKVNENMNATNQFDSLRNIQRYFRSIPDKFERSHHDYKASYWLLDYKDETEFSMEVALRLHLEEFSYYVEVFIGQPHESSKMMKLFAKALQVFAKDEEPITKFKSFNCLEKKYGVGIGEDEIKSLAREIGKSTVEELKKNISERKND